MFFPLGPSCHRAGGIYNLPPIKANDSRFRSTDLLQCRLAVVETVNKLAPLLLIEKMLGASCSGISSDTIFISEQSGAARTGED
jgi:hypothetical protein